MLTTLPYASGDGCLGIRETVPKERFGGRELGPQRDHKGGFGTTIGPQECSKLLRFDPKRSLVVPPKNTILYR